MGHDEYIAYGVWVSRGVQARMGLHSGGGLDRKG
jgi:hypothetical protein